MAPVMWRALMMAAGRLVWYANVAGHKQNRARTAQEAHAEKGAEEGETVGLNAFRVSPPGL